MTEQSRRDFMKRGAAVTGGLAMASAGAETKAADMCIARWKGTPKADEPTDIIAPKLVEQAIEALGGMKRFVKAGDVVWLKPNISWDRTPEQAANTNPDAVKTVVRLCLEAGAKTVKVGDNTCHRDRSAYVTSGIKAAAEEAGAKVLYIDKRRFRDTDIGGASLKNIPVYPEMVEADLLISMPVVKHHSIAKVTVCMKNYMGVIEHRSKLHQDIDGCLRDLTVYLKPKISILDAIRILTANGPTGGDLADVKRLNTIAVGTDIVALDAFGAELLGHKPADIATVATAHKGGLGEMDYRKLALREIEVS